jgi:serine/threonine protein kinase
MDPLVRSLFHELADLSHVEREKIFVEQGISPELRAEVESLLRFDFSENHTNMHWGSYRPVGVLGTGGMATVYLAERTDGEIFHKAAIKVLRTDVQRPEWRNRFLKERQLLAYLNHPSIVHLIDAGHTSDGQPYLVMEYVNGIPVDEYTANMELRDRLSLFLRVCDGVSHAHQRLIIHCDLKPSNILVDVSGQPKLLDFGIAKLIENRDRTQTLLTLAEVQGVPTITNLGQSADSEQALVKANKLVENILKASPGDRKALMISAEINQDRMILASADNRREEVPLFAQQAAHSVELLLKDGASEEEKRPVLQILSNVALAYKNLHAYGDSVRYARRAVDISQKTHIRSTIVANALSIAADSLRYSGDLDGALATI